MRIDNKTEPHPLFKSVSDDGSLWLFVILSDDRWAITRDGARVLAGTSDTASIQAGVEKFLFFARDRTMRPQAVVLDAQSSFQSSAATER